VVQGTENLENGRLQSRKYLGGSQEVEREWKVAPVNSRFQLLLLSVDYYPR